MLGAIGESKIPAPTIVLRLIPLLLAIVLFVACAATMEQTARDELTERGFHEVTLQPLQRENYAYSFEGTVGGESCQGEIELQEQMGQTLATVTSQCGQEQ